MDQAVLEGASKVLKEVFEDYMKTCLTKKGHRGPKRSKLEFKRL